MQLEIVNVSVTRFWDDLAVFFAETLNDHDSHYLPWCYQRGVEKGSGFDRLSATELYALAAKRHEWLHRYLRLVLTRHTELTGLPEIEQDALLGAAALPRRGRIHLSIAGRVHGAEPSLRCGGAG